MQRVCVCARAEAHLVDTPDCLFDRGWGCKLGLWQDTLLDNLQEMTGTHALHTVSPYIHTHAGCAQMAAIKKKPVCVDNPAWLNVSSIQTQRHACQHAVGGDKTSNVLRRKQTRARGRESTQPAHASVRQLFDVEKKGKNKRK